MNWTFEITEHPTEIQQSALCTIYESFPHKFFHQDPDWLLLHQESSSVLVVTDADNVIVAYAGLQLKAFRTIHIAFGPLTKPGIDAGMMIADIANWLKQTRRWRLTVQLPIPDGDEVSHMLRNISKQIHFRQSDKFFNWKSWWLTIDREPRDLLKSFRSQHQKSIQQSAKKGIRYLIITDPGKAADFALLHNMMYKYRKLPNDESKNLRFITALHSFLQASGKGFLMGAELDGNLIGGVMIVFQGNTAYYYLGASTTQQKRSIPILYGAFYEIILHCWQHNIQTLDFGGFAVGEKEGSQLFNINRFKMGFGGRLVDYPGQMVFDLNPLLSRGIEKGIQLRNILRKRRQQK